MKTAMQMVQDCEALQELEHLTADNWHDMAEADACLVAAPYGLGQTTRGPSVRGTSKGGAAPPDVRPLVSRLHAGRHDTGGAIMRLGPPIRDSVPPKPDWLPVPGRPHWFRSTDGRNRWMYAPPLSPTR